LFFPFWPYGCDELHELIWIPYYPNLTRWSHKFGILEGQFGRIWALRPEHSVSKVLLFDITKLKESDWSTYLKLICLGSFTRHNCCIRILFLEMCYYYITLSYINFTLRYIGCVTYIYKTHIFKTHMHGSHTFCVSV
jgi:hypothetical protein